MDFVDVDIVRDTPAFLSPKALTMLPSEFGDECVHLVQNFFHTILEKIRAGQNSDAERLLRQLREPNETRLGLSRGRARGHALGSGSAHGVWQSLSKSEAARTGLIEDLEDTVLMIEGISIDIVSDMATNIIREPLIRYTQQMCTQYEIPTFPDVEVRTTLEFSRSAMVHEIHSSPDCRKWKTSICTKSIGPNPFAI